MYLHRPILLFFRIVNVICDAIGLGYYLIPSLTKLMSLKKELMYFTQSCQL